MGKLIFENLIDTTDYEANNILRANQLNASLKQPEVATYALLKAISGYFENTDTAGANTTVDINESEGADLQTILTKAFKGINNIYANSSSVETTLSKSGTYATMKINSSSPNYANSIEFNDKLTIKSNTNLSFGIEISNSNYSKISGSKIDNIGQLIYSSVKSGKTRNVNFDDVADLIKNGNVSIKNTSSVIEVDSTTSLNHATISPTEFSVKPTTDSFAYAQMGLYFGGFVRIRPDNNGAYGHIHCIEYDDGDPDEPNYQQCVELQLFSEANSYRRVSLGETGYGEGFALEIRETGSSYSQLKYDRLSFYNSIDGLAELKIKDIKRANNLTDYHLYYVEILASATGSGIAQMYPYITLRFYVSTTNANIEGAETGSTNINYYLRQLPIDNLPCSGFLCTGTYKSTTSTYNPAYDVQSIRVSINMSLQSTIWVHKCYLDTLDYNNKVQEVSIPVSDLDASSKIYIKRIS